MTSKQMITGLMLLIGFIGLVFAFISMRKKIHFQNDRILSKLKLIGLNDFQANIVRAISNHETGGNTSTLSKSPYNNYFGMHMPKGTAEQMQRRQTLATGADENNWAKFKTLEDSVQDYVNWFGYHNTDIKTLLISAENLVSFMRDKGYFTDTYNNYIGGVKQWL